MLKNLVKVEILLFLSHWVSSRESGSEGSLTYFTVCKSRGFRKMWHQHNSTVAHQSNIWACHKFINRFLQKVLTKLTGKRILVLGTSRNYYFDHKKFQDIPRQIKSIQDIQLFLTLTPTPHPPPPPPEPCSLRLTLKLTPSHCKVHPMDVQILNHCLPHPPLQSHHNQINQTQIMTSVFMF